MKEFAHSVIGIVIGTTFILSFLLFFFKILLIDSESAMTKKQLRRISPERVKMFEKYDSLGGNTLAIILLLVVVFSIFLGVFSLIFPFSIVVILLGGLVWFEALAALKTDVYRRYGKFIGDHIFIYDKEGKIRWIANLLFWVSSIMLVLHFIALILIWGKF
jgi:hypothetical protein